jgi:metallophosphoesterase superfamily enzyme
MDCKVIPGECAVTQHKLLVADFHLQVGVRRDRGVKITKTKWWKGHGTKVRMRIICGRR